MPKSIYSGEYDRFRKALREARTSAGVTQAELADRLGWNQTQISKCERGERRLDIVETRRWCLALGVGFESFVADLEASLGRPRKRARR